MVTIWRLKYLSKHKKEWVKGMIAKHILDRMGYCWADLVCWYTSGWDWPFEEVSRPSKEYCIKCDYCGRATARGWKKEGT